jgi:predicted nucleic acid-binding protein
MTDALVDTSVAVASIIAGHEANRSTLDALGDRTLGLAGHAWFETFSVLTRMPAPARRAAGEVAAILAHNFPGSYFLTPGASAELTQRLPQLGITGGAVYDGLVGTAAASAGLTLITRDRRALDTYRAVGASVELLS